jgi:hypothetical protein
MSVTEAVQWTEERLFDRNSVSVEELTDCYLCETRVPVK